MTFQIPALFKDFNGMHEPGNLLGTGGTDAFDTIKPGLYIAIRHAGPVMLVGRLR